MLIVVENLPHDGRRFTGELEVDLAVEAGPDECAAAGPVRYDLRAQAHGSSVEISGALEAKVDVTCGRCSVRFSIPVERGFETLFAAAEKGAQGAPSELDEDALALDYYEDGVIDGHQLLAEQILLALPMKLLCGEECKGLCTVCGVNLNDNECDCEADVDPRLASLKALRDRL